jgi:hypothetical protein
MKNDQITIVIPEARRKAKNVRRDNRVTIPVDAIKPRGRGVTIYGKAELEAQTGPTADVISWAEKYTPGGKAGQYVEALCRLTSLREP